MEALILTIFIITAFKFLGDILSKKPAFSFTNAAVCTLTAWHINLALGITLCSFFGVLALIWIFTKL